MSTVNTDQTVDLGDGQTIVVSLNLNVMKVLQAKYGTYNKWLQLMQPKKGAEVDLDALIFGFREMINEALDSENDGKPEAEQKPMYTEKQVGRLVTKMGLANAGAAMAKLMRDSTKDDNPKNA